MFDHQRITAAGPLHANMTICKWMSMAASRVLVWPFAAGNKSPPLIAQCHTHTPTFASCLRWLGLHLLQLRSRGIEPETYYCDLRIDESALVAKYTLDFSESGAPPISFWEKGLAIKTFALSLNDKEASMCSKSSAYDVMVSIQLIHETCVGGDNKAMKRLVVCNLARWKSQYERSCTESLIPSHGDIGTMVDEYLLGREPPPVSKKVKRKAE